MHMHKILTATLFSLSFSAFSSCPEQQNLDVQTSIEANGVKAGGNHGFMDVVTISVPKSVSNLPFESIRLTHGEVAEYWIPLDTNLLNNRIVATLFGYQDSIQNFEFWVNYSNGVCSLYQTGTIGDIYTKQLRQGW